MPVHERTKLLRLITNKTQLNDRRKVTNNRLFCRQP